MLTELFSTYLNELIAVLSITVLAVISPGADFAMVVRNSIKYSKESGIYTGLGVAAATQIHVFYTIAGIGLLLTSSTTAFTIVKWLGAIYLCYIGILCLRSGGSHINDHTKEQESISRGKSFKLGFLTNALNPKATLFFMSLFSQVVSPTTPLSIQFFYGGMVSFCAVIWFSTVSLLLNKKGIKQKFCRFQNYIEKAMGVVLIFFAIQLSFF